MIPTRERAEAELLAAQERNPGKWVSHSRFTAQAAEAIAARCPGMNPEKAYICGLLHDIGRREGVYATRHGMDGYDYALQQGWDEVARVCLSHSYPAQDADMNVGKNDLTPDQERRLRAALAKMEYDDYDRLIILCDALAEAGGFCILEKRFVDVSMRYGIYPFILVRWERTLAYKVDFEKRMGCSVYTVLPGIEQCIYR